MRRAVERPAHARQGGFSLLEILVAFAILAMSLGLIYQITGSNARTTADLAGQEQAMILAESLLAANPVVPPEGLNGQGDSQGYAWRIASQPFPTPVTGPEGEVPRLHEIKASVSWSDGTRERQFELTSLRPERLPTPAGALR